MPPLREPLSLSSSSKAALRIQLRTNISPYMFVLSLAFLGVIAALLVLWIDVPRTLELNDLDIVAELENLADPTALAESDAGVQAIKRIDRRQELLFQSKAATWSGWLVGLLGVLWILFLAEQIAYLSLADSWQQFRLANPYALAICLLPPLRLCSRHHEAEGCIWFPILGWQRPTPAFQRELERHTSIPMIGIALLILPVLGLQMLYGANIVQHPWLRVALHLATGLIWFAFATEFLVMVSVTDKKLKYCKRHWLDLVIILLPLISFLRSWRLLRASKLVKISKLQQLTRIIRAYRLRGVTMRALRAFLVLDLTQRIMRIKPEQRLAKLEELYAEKQEELAELQKEIEQLRGRVPLEPSRRKD